MRINRNSHAPKIFKLLFITLMTMTLVGVMGKIIRVMELTIYNKIFKVIYFVPSEEVTTIIPLMFGVIFITSIGWRFLEERDKTPKEKFGFRVLWIILIIISIIMAFNATIFTDKVVKKYSIMNITGKEYKYLDVKEVRIITETAKSGIVTVKYVLYFANSEIVEAIIETEESDKIGDIENIERMIPDKINHIIENRDYENIIKKRRNIVKWVEKKFDVVR